MTEQNANLGKDDPIIAGFLAVDWTEMSRQAAEAHEQARRLREESPALSAQIAGLLADCDEILARQKAEAEAEAKAQKQQRERSHRPSLALPLNQEASPQREDDYEMEI